MSNVNLDSLFISESIQKEEKIPCIEIHQENVRNQRGGFDLLLKFKFQRDLRKKEPRY